MIRPYLSDKINDHKTLKKLGVYSSNEVFHYETRYGEWKIQLAMSTDFTSSKDSNECRNMHKKLMQKKNNVRNMISSETDDIADELSKSCLQ